jgi:hypothetical protein
MRHADVGSDSLKVDADDSALPGQVIRLAGSALGTRRHICAFFSNHDEGYRVLLPFIKDGLDRGEMAVHIVDPRRRHEHVHQLQCAGIDVPAVQHDGQLDVREWADAHLRDGSFDQNRTLALMAGIRERSRTDGFSRIRFVTDMMWAFEDRPGVDSLLEYEASANLVESQDPVVCFYDLTRVGGDLVVEVMRTHPMVIIGGILQENPFFVPPEQFLRELREKRARSSLLSD